MLKSILSLFYRSPDEAGGAASGLEVPPVVEAPPVVEVPPVVEAPPVGVSEAPDGDDEADERGPLPEEAALPADLRTTIDVIRRFGYPAARQVVNAARGDAFARAVASGILSGIAARRELVPGDTVRAAQLGLDTARSYVREAPAFVRPEEFADLLNLFQGLAKLGGGGDKGPGGGAAGDMSCKPAEVHAGHEQPDALTGAAPSQIPGQQPIAPAVCGASRGGVACNEAPHGPEAFHRFTPTAEQREGGATIVQWMPGGVA